MDDWRVNGTWQMAVVVVSLAVLPVGVFARLGDADPQTKALFVGFLIVLPFLLSSFAVWSRLAKIQDPDARSDRLERILAGVVLIVLAVVMHFWLPGSPEAMTVSNRWYIPKIMYLLGGLALAWATAGENADSGD